MNSSQSANLFVNPLLMWSRLVWRASEMAIASSQVIGHRMQRLSLAGPIPNARDQREFALMGREKGEAALESSQAVGVPLLVMTHQFASFAFKQMFDASTALLSIATSRTPAESVERQSKLVQDTLTSSVAAASKLSGSAAKVARIALKPVHARVKGNVTRLGKRSGK